MKPKITSCFSFTLSLLIILICHAPIAKAQEPDPNIFFADKKENFQKFCLEHLPTLEECKLVLKEDAAEKYYPSIQAMQERIPYAPVQTDVFVDMRIETFTTEDVLAGKGNYPGGFNRIGNLLQPGITFVEVNMLREKGADYGVAYKNYVYLNDKWVFFPKIWMAFKEEK